MASMQAPAAEQQRRDGELDPVYEWLDDGASYLLRLKLPEFKKEDFRVHVDPAGRLTVLGQRAAAGAGQAVRLHKAFQLPPTANLDAITGRFDGGVLTLTVPKLPQPGAVAPPPPPPPPPPQAKEERVAGEPKELQEDRPAMAGSGGEAETTERRIEAERASLTVKGKEDDEVPKAEAPPSKKARRDHDESAIARAAEHKENVAREAARRIEAARARLAEAKAAAERTGAHWKERAAPEVLKLAEAASKNKEVIATAVVAFTLGVLSHKLFSRS
ncbi:hypothetical protein ACP70R_037288 [Stipagrostis hirtigluma subsp. patula]